MLILSRLVLLIVSVKVESACFRPKSDNILGVMLLAILRAESTASLSMALMWLINSFFSSELSARLSSSFT